MRAAFNDEEVYETQKNQIGKNVQNCFFNFLANYELKQDDPNFDNYLQAVGADDPNAKLLYYVHKAQRMRDEEKNTMEVDFRHLNDYPHADPEFMKNLVTNFYRYENDIRQGLSLFMQAQSENPQSLTRSYF